MNNKNIVSIVALLLVSAILMLPLVSCSQDGGSEDGKIDIVTTVFPVYDWVREILGDKTENVNLTLLLDSGVDLHSYQPSTDDIIKISSCDMLVYVGGTSDDWLDDILKNVKNKNMKTVDLMEILADDLLCAEVNNGTPHDHSHDEHEHDHAEDEHVWLSLRNAKKVCADICKKLTELDPDNKEAYEANLSSYTAKLDALDGEYANTVSTASKKTLLFGDRFPFIYMTNDYGIENFAAFSGCSAESEASFETVTFLAKKMDELHLGYVMTTEGSIDGIAETIISATTAKDATVLALDSMQSKTYSDVQRGETYLSVMQKNLGVLKIALN